MKTQRWIPLLAAWFGLSLADLARSAEDRTLYQITAGKYEVDGGFSGHLEIRLPHPPQTFVALTVDPTGTTATLTFLGDDRTTVFRTLTNGVVSASVVRFTYQTDHPIYPDLIQPSEVQYVVTIQNHRLLIEGAIRVLEPPCCDIPHYFAHTNVVAVAFPELSIRVSAIELCWTTHPDVVYQLQHRAGAEGDEWTNLGTPIAGTGGTVCFTAHPIAGQPSGYYRILPAGNRGPTP